MYIDDFGETDILDNAIENYFFVDYENVNRDGLNGIGHLTENDCVKIYYSENAQTLSFGLHRRINACMARFQYAKIETYGIENAIDMHILMEIKQAYILNKNTSFFIVSKDGDFDKAIVDYNRKGIKTKKISQICESYNPGYVKTVDSTVVKTEVNKNIDKREQILRSMFGRHFKESPYKENKEVIIKILLASIDKQSLNNALTKIIPSDYIPNILNQFSNVFSPLPNSLIIDKKTEDNINTTIQSVLSKANFGVDIVNYTASLVCKNKENKNQIYKALVMKYGQNKGLNIYNHIKKLL